VPGRCPAIGAEYSVPGHVRMTAAAFTGMQNTASCARVCLVPSYVSDGFQPGFRASVCCPRNHGPAWRAKYRYPTL
jgi:hypothetical protein